MKTPRASESISKMGDSIKKLVATPASKESLAKFAAHQALKRKMGSK